jgi:hypothetical protein
MTGMRRRGQSSMSDGKGSISSIAPAMGGKVAGCDLPILFVMEGRYAVDGLGVNTVNVLQ